MKTERRASLVALRTSILATLGLAACTGTVAQPTGSGGNGGAGGTTGTTTDTTTTVTTSTVTGTTTSSTTVTTTTSTTTTDTTSTTSTTTSSTTTTSTATVGCAGAVPVLAGDGSPSGFMRCPDGTMHRSEAASCSPDVGIVPCALTEDEVQCGDDADCTASPNSRCSSLVLPSGLGQTYTSCQCVLPCTQDADCGGGRVCVCAGVVDAPWPWATCSNAAACATDADCPSGECAITSYHNGCWQEVELACRAPTDACRADKDCADPQEHCVIPYEGQPFVCAGQTCFIGRPLLVEGEARTAAPADRDDWIAGGLAPRVDGLDRATREAVAAHWLGVAALEHASVASFARFTLELLALGAPADLLHDAQRAGLDEIEHARVAYALAGAYAGERFGPGALDLTRVALRADRRAILRSLVDEACVGETLGVAEALELAGLVADPVIAEVHARIAADEQRHAELAWRTLAWILAGADEETVRFTERCFDEAIAVASRDLPACELHLPEHGLRSSAATAASRRRALSEVVAPCAAALLSRPTVFSRAAALEAALA